MTNDKEMRSLSAVFGRVLWMMLGPLILVLLTFVIVSTGSGWLTWADIAFVGVLASMLLARWVEFQRGHPQTATGEPATPTDLRRYVRTILPVGATVWFLANLMGNHLLDR